MSLIGEPRDQNLAKGPPAGDLVKDGSDAGFMDDVIEASMTTPVIVDFWAPWCGPCRQLGPAIERAVLAAKGKVKLVKIDIDQHPQYAGQLKVQSIPAVFAFHEGRQVDGFMGALPESQVKAFVDRLAGEGPPDATDDLLALAKESRELGDPGGAAQAYAQVLQRDPENVKALGGMARIHLDGGDPDSAREIAGMVPPGVKDVDIDSVRVALALADAAPSETQGFEQRLAADADDHEARYELSKALAGRGRWQEAADHLLTIIERDRTWNGEAARRQLLTIFEAAGPGSDITRSGRRRLSSILFS
jgi:putative thioredoxin